MFGFILLLVLAWVGTTWFIGNKTETWLKEHIQTTQKAYSDIGMEIQFDLLEYQKESFLSSTAKTRLQLKTGNIITDEILKNIPFNSRIQHGPLLFINGMPHLGIASVQSTLDTSRLDPKIRLLVSTLFQENNPLQVQIIHGFDDTVDYRLDIAAIDLKEKEAQLSLDQGIHLSGSINKANLIGTLEGNIGRFTSVENNKSITTSPSSFHIETQGRVANQMLGSIKFSAPLVKLQGMEGFDQPLQFAVDLSTDTHQGNASSLEGSLTVALSKITGVLNISDITFKTVAKEIKTKGLEQIAVIQNDIQALQNSTSTTISPAEQQAILEKINSLPALIAIALQNTLSKDKTQLTLQLDIASKEGASHLDLSSRYVGNGTDINLTTFESADLKAFLQIVNGQFNVVVPKEMLDKLPMPLLTRYIEKGILIETDKQYRANINFENKGIVLNGKSLSPDEFVALFELLPR